MGAQAFLHQPSPSTWLRCEAPLAGNILPRDINHPDADVSEDLKGRLVEIEAVVAAAWAEVGDHRGDGVAVGSVDEHALAVAGKEGQLLG